MIFDELVTEYTERILKSTNKENETAKIIQEIQNLRYSYSNKKTSNADKILILDRLRQEITTNKPYNGIFNEGCVVDICKQNDRAFRKRKNGCLSSRSARDLDKITIKGHCRKMPIIRDSDRPIVITRSLRVFRERHIGGISLPIGLSAQDNKDFLELINQAIKELGGK